MSLSYQINIRILISALIILLLGSIITFWHARSAIDDEIEASVAMTAHIITCGLSQKSPNDASWLRCISSLKETRHLKIELVKPDGSLLELGQHDKHQSGENPPPSWFIGLIGSERTKIEMPLTTSVGEQFSLSIQANPLDEIREVWEESLGFYGTILVLTLLTFLSVYLALSKSIKSINTIVLALQSIETGNYMEKLPQFQIKEYNSIAKAINHMTEELDKARRENQALTQHSLEIVEIERKQLAKELHDELGQSLTAIKMMAVSANRQPNQIKYLTEEIEKICDSLINVVRSMMQQLHPLVLTELGLKAALEDLLTRWAMMYPALKVSLNCDDAIDDSHANTTIQIFRIVQECLTNIVRHSQANRADISLKVSSAPCERATIEVTDYGLGCSVAQIKKGFGLLGIKERVQSLGGTLKIETQPGKGFALKVELPLPDR
jgi:two-component system, NarL family, sensor histidine kinase UhpB